jgi:hypothetical protein
MCPERQIHTVGKLASASQRGSVSLANLTRKEIERITHTMSFYVQDAFQIEYPDLIQAGRLLVSGKLKAIMSQYQSDVIFKPLMLIEEKKKRQELYYLTAAPLLEGVVTETKQEHPEYRTKDVVDEAKAGNARIFSTGKYGRQLYVRLDVAESILRRDPYGVWFEKVRVESAGIKETGKNDAKES